MSTARPEDDTDDWLLALAGRPRAGTAPATLREARWLREAIQRWPAAADRAEASETLAALPSDAEAALLARAVHAGLLPAEGAPPQRPGLARWCAGCAGRGQRLRAWLGQRPAAAGLALATAALLVVGVWQLQPPAAPPGTPPLLRGAQQDGSWLLQDADPQTLRDAWALRLQATGASVRRYERLGRYGLDAEWPAPAPGLDAQLAGMGLRRGPDGSLRLEVEAPPTPRR